MRSEGKAIITLAEQDASWLTPNEFFAEVIRMGVQSPPDSVGIVRADRERNSSPRA